MLATNDAYQVNGNVWFNTQKNLEYYGRTSGQKIENMSFEETTFEKRHKEILLYERVLQVESNTILHLIQVDQDDIQSVLL
ncbi:hypothetical protein [Mycoplasmopsis cynos]|uniref:hypothetical protein n=1 Tax=Mycoplasmopsis cynos TaxID=171284 RepID=UPI00220F2C17|nr:hypothetical protein [Mycoplasmopsis cynos]UWV82513.1 hypothetical protein NW067_06105 [Mycoplasmopsis cynos]